MTREEIMSTFGWTPDMVTALLGGNSDYTFSDVMNARKSPEFQKFVQLQKVSQGREAIIEALKEPISVKYPPVEELQRFCCNSADISENKRRMVNNLRHQFSNYDQLIGDAKCRSHSDLRVQAYKFSIHQRYLGVYQQLGLDSELQGQVATRCNDILEFLNNT